MPVLSGGTRLRFDSPRQHSARSVDCTSAALVHPALSATSESPTACRFCSRTQRYRVVRRPPCCAREVKPAYNKYRWSLLGCAVKDAYDSTTSETCVSALLLVAANSGMLSTPLCIERGSHSRTAKDIEQDYIKLWKDITVRDPSGVQPVTLRSSLYFVPAWIKYEATPLPVRFVWNFIWIHLMARVQILRRYLTLQGGHGSM